MNVADMVAISKETEYRRRAAGRGRRGRRRSRAAHQLRRLSGRQGGGEARARQGQPRRPPHRHPGRGQRRRRLRAARRRRGRPAQHRRRRPGPRRRRWPPRPAARSVGTDEIMTLEADVLSPNALGAILDARIDRGAQRADRRRRRQQPARHARRRRPNPGARHPLRARLCDQRRRHHQRLDRISRGTATRTWSAAGSRRSRAGSTTIWQESAATGRNPARVAGDMARRLIGRALGRRGQSQ